MDPSNFQNFGGMGMAQPGAQMVQQMMPQQSAQDSHAIGNYIVSALRSEGPYGGWQAQVPVEQRVSQIKLLVDSLRLIRPAVKIQQFVQVAMTFEKKAFITSENRDAYLRACTEKLSKIRDQRQQQASQTGPMLNTPMQHPDFQTQQFLTQDQFLPQQPPMMQPSPMPAQGLVQNNFGMVAPQQQINPQHMPGMNQPQPANNQNQARLTEEENKKVNGMASQLARSTNLTPAQKELIKNRYSAQARETMNKNGVDPIHLYYRQQALNLYRSQRNSAQMNAGLMNVNGSTQQGMNMDQNQFQFQMPPNSGNQQQVNSFQQPNNQMMGNLTHFQGRQADGMRAQDFGELVVPASLSNQGVSQEQYRQQQMALQNGMPQMGAQPGINPQLLARQQQMKAMQANQPNPNEQIHTLAQFQNQSQAQARIHAAAKAQVVGIPTPPTVSAATAAPNIVRPLSQTLAVPSPQVGTRTPNRTPNPMPPQGQTQPNQAQLTANQNRELALRGFPPNLQNILRQKPQSEWQAIIVQFSQGANNMRRSVSSQPQGGVQQAQGMPPGQNPQMRMQNGPNMAATPMVSSLSAGAAQKQMQDANSLSAAQQLQQQQLSRMQASQFPNPQPMMQQQQQQPGLQGMQQPRPGAKPNMEIKMTPQQVAYMDKQAFPQTMLPQLFRNVPNVPVGQLRVWADLKRWLTANPVQSVTLAHLIVLQQRQLMAIMKNAGNGGQQLVNNNRPFEPTQSGTPAMQQQISMLKPIDSSDLERVRMVQPQLREVDDEKLRVWLEQQRANQIRLRQERQPHPGQAPQQMPMSVAQQPPNVSVGVNQPLLFAPVQTAQLSGIGNQQSVNPIFAPGGVDNSSSAKRQPFNRQQSANAASKLQLQAPSQRGQGQGDVPGAKNLKRPNEESTQDGNQVNMANHAQPVSQMTKEMFDSLTNDQKLAYQKMRRSQQAQQSQAAKAKVDELTKQMQIGKGSLVPIKNMTAEDKEVIRRILNNTHTHKMLVEFEKFIVAFFLIAQNEPEVRLLLEQSTRLLRQYKPETVKKTDPEKTFVPVDVFSVSRKYVEEASNNLSRRFQLVLQRSAQSRPQLTPENLKQLEAQEASLKATLNTKSSKAPPAPTSAQPPFPIDADRGHGAPRYAQQTIKQEDLKLPPNKKSKKGTTLSAQAATSPPASKATEDKKVQPSSNIHLCPMENCEYSKKGFATLAELSNHTNSVHKPEEPIEDPTIHDPVGYLAAATRFALDLDVNGQPLRQPEVIKAPPMQKSISRLSATSMPGIKHEKDSKPSTPAAMIRAPSSSSITQASPGLKPIPRSVPNAKTAQNTPPAPFLKVEPDLWSTTKIGLNKLRETFGGIDMGEVVPSISRGVGDGEGIGLDLEAMMEEYMQSDAWIQMQGAAAALSSTDCLSSETGTEKSKSLSPAMGADELGVKDEQVKQANDILAELGLDSIEPEKPTTSGTLGKPNADAADVDMSDSWVLPEINAVRKSTIPGQLPNATADNVAGDFSSELDEWDEWLKMDIGELPDIDKDGNAIYGEDERFPSPFEEIDWDNAVLEDAYGANRVVVRR